MSLNGQHAYVTGGASGLGRATAQLLAKKGANVYIADLNAAAAEQVAAELNAETGAQLVCSTAVDVSDWESQARAFTEAVGALGRIDHVYPIAGIGERRWLPRAIESSTEFVKPDLGVLDVDLTGFLYTVGLAVQQFRRQQPRSDDGIRGSIGCVASVCGFYCASTLPIYTAAKHAVTGFVRSYGKYLPVEGIRLNAVNPNVIRTNISMPAFYDHLQSRGLLTPIEGVIDTFEALLDGDLETVSGEIYEIGPNYGKDGERWVIRDPAVYLDKESHELFDLLDRRGRPLQGPH